MLVKSHFDLLKPDLAAYKRLADKWDLSPSQLVHLWKSREFIEELMAENFLSQFQERFEAAAEHCLVEDGLLTEEQFEGSE